MIFRYSMLKDTSEIYQDDILNVAANAANYVNDRLPIEEKHWELIYNNLIDVLNKIFNEPDFRNYN